MEDNDTFENISCKINGETELMEAMGKKKNTRQLFSNPLWMKCPRRKREYKAKRGESERERKKGKGEEGEETKDQKGERAKRQIGWGSKCRKGALTVWLRGWNASPRTRD